MYRLRSLNGRVQSGSDNLLSQVSLLVALAIPALQAMGVTVDPYLASILWLAVGVFSITLIWRDYKWPISLRAGTTFLLLVGLGALCYRSFAGPIVPLAKVEVALFEAQRVPLKEIPFKQISEFAAGLNKAFPTMDPIPYPIGSVNGKYMMNVVLKNTSDIPMKNASVSILANIPIHGESDGVRPFSDNDVDFEFRSLRPFKDLGVENFATISFVPPPSNQPVVFTVTVESDNSAPYAGMQVFSFTAR